MADRKLSLRIVSPRSATDKKPYRLQKSSDLVILRCVSGDLGVMAGRTPCVMALDSGVLRYFDEGREHFLAVMGGVAHVKGDAVTVLTDSALEPKEIDAAEVGARLRAAEEKAAAEHDPIKKAALKSELRGLRVQLEVAGKRAEK